MPKHASSCPCGLPRTYQKCCGRYISGSKTPPIAEALMRSRYTAFALGEVGYLLATCVDETKADETKAALSSEQIAENCRTTTYLGLKIIAKSGGTRKHTEASVEFKVSYKSLGTIHTHHETSHFIKTNGSWKYLDGDVSIT